MTKKENLKDIKNVVVVGLGGIGSKLLPELCRFLNCAYPDKINLILVDGDNYDEGNFVRQEFTMDKVGQPKAICQADKISESFVNIESISPYPEYLSVDNADKLIPEDSVVFSCVDNHATRKDIQERCAVLKDCILISGGNDYTDGNVQIYSCKKGKPETPRIDDYRYHKEIFKPADRNPAEMSCEELSVLPSGAQTSFTNMSVASHMLNLFFTKISGELTGKNKYEEIYLDITQGKSATFERKL